MSELAVAKRIETLLDRVYPALRNFPTMEHSGLCEYIKLGFFDALSYIDQANSVKSKRIIYLQEAEGRCRAIQRMIKFSNRQKYIGVEFNRQIDLELSNICEMISNWIKASSK